MVRLPAMLCCLFCMLSAVAALPAQAAESWVLNVDLWGNPAYQTLTLARDGATLSGDLDGDRVAGSVSGTQIAFTATDNSGVVSRFAGALGADTMQGSADFPDSNNPEARALHAYTGRRIPARPPGPPQRHVFVPSDYSNLFSPHRAPVLTMWPGDSVVTTTVDSGGVDEHGVTRALFGNPQTGPFFVAGAVPGDTLVVHVRRLRLNRDYADSLDSIVGRALGASLAAKAGELGKPVRWRLDRERGLASPESAGGHMQQFAVPVRPMLGGLAVAPGFGSAPVSTGDTGRFGGNMDFNEVVAGNTVYLPVQQPGALLYLGDAHALQGDGETSQYALETSMEVELTVDLVKGTATGKAIGMPRVESPTQIMALGQAGSLDEALRAATTGLVLWLQQDYGLTLSESAQVLGSAVHYSVPNLAGRSVGVAAKLDKSVLATLRRSP